MGYQSYDWSFSVMPFEVQKAKDSGLDDTLSKPLKKEKVKECIERWCHLQGQLISFICLDICKGVGNSLDNEYCTWSNPVPDPSSAGDDWLIELKKHQSSECWRAATGGSKDSFWFHKIRINAIQQNHRLGNARFPKWISLITETGSWKAIIFTVLVSEYKRELLQ